MSAPHIHGTYRTIPSTLLLETLGASLGRIKQEDGATWGDLGRVLGKSADRAAAYADGLGDMGIVSFLFGCREWDGRFANDVLALVGMRLAPIGAPEPAGDRTLLRALGALVVKNAIALEQGAIDEAALDEMWPEIEVLSACIDRLRWKRRGRALLLTDQR